MPNITPLDYYLLPFYLGIIYLIAFFIRNRKYPVGHAWRPYFIPGLTVKIFGALFIGLLYNYYYGGGDTFNYFFHSKLINESFSESPQTWYRLITHNADLQNRIDNLYVDELYWYDEKSTYTIGVIGALIGVFTFTKYLPICVILATIAFTGSWVLFKTFALQYPQKIKAIAFAILFIPSTFIWGSALFKDTICMFAIGWLTYCFYFLIGKRKFKLKLFLMFIVSIWLLYSVKLYILLSLLPFLIIKELLTFIISFKSVINKIIVLTLSLAIVVVSAFIGNKKLQAEKSMYSVETIGVTAKRTADYLLRVSEDQDGSGYSLGEFEPTLNGMLKKFIPAVNVTLFRPYLWEVRKPLTLLSALESLFFLLFTLKIIFTNNPFKLMKRVVTDPNILLCLCFSIFFAFFAGISSFNFGSLSRYKIPCLPFYLIALILLNRKSEKQIIEVSESTENQSIS